MPAPMDPSRRRPDRPRAWFVPRPLHRFLEQSVEMRPISLRFIDPGLETDFQAAYFTVSLPYLRLAHVLGIVLWVVFVFLADIVIPGDQGADLVIRYGIAVPALVISLGVTYTRWFRGTGASGCRSSCCSTPGSGRRIGCSSRRDERSCSTGPCDAYMRPERSAWSTASRV